MRRHWRWLVVGTGALVLLLLPATVAHLPVARSSVPLDTLLARVRASASVGYSGYAESTGGLSLPVGGQLDSVNDLFGGTTHHPGADDSPVEAPMTLELDYDPRTQRFTGTSTEGGGAPRPVCLAPVVPPPER